MDKKKVIIIVLVIMVIVLSALLVLSKVGTKDEHTRADFINNIVNLQAKVSYYVANTYSETFGVYNKEDIVLGGKNTDKETNENENEGITPIVDSNKKFEKGSTVAYEIIPENFSKILNVSLPEYEGVTWYIQGGEFLRVSGDPSWWTSDLNSLKVGK